MSKLSIRRWMGPFVAGTVLAFLLSAVVAARDPQRPRAGEAKATASAAQASGARLVALVDAGGKIVRQKGVRSVKRVDKGSYCIRPSASSGVSIRKAVVAVSPEYFHSGLTEIQVQWASKGACSTKQIGVYTNADPEGDGTYAPSNEVAFSIIVP